MNRREFLESSTAAAAGLGIFRWTPAPASERPILRQSQARPEQSRGPIGIQVGAVSFLDEGTDQVLDTLRELGTVDTLFLATFTYGRGIGGRQPRGSPLPDHGKQEYDDNYHGGNFATPHPQFYKNTSIQPQKAPDHPGYDVIADVLPKAHARGMKVICWYEDVFRKGVPGLDKAFEVDVHGQPQARVCYRNPNTLNFWLGLTEDYLRSYEVDGLMFGSERQGPLNNALGASHGGGPSPSTVGCFCPHCLTAAKKEGINPDRARQGYLSLEKWLSGMKGKERSPDGAFVTFWRILVEHPEVLGWERLWNEGLRDTYRAMYRKAHEVAPGKPIGLAHLAHQLLRAVLSRRAGLPDVHAVLGFPEGGDVPQQRRPTHGAVHPEHQLDALCGSHDRPDDRAHVSLAAVHLRTAVRQAADRGTLRRVCAP
jgi:hypothetical protein